MASSVLVGTSDGLYELAVETTVQFAGHKVSHLAPDTSGWWAIVNDNELWRGQGGNWERAASSDGLRLNCVIPTPSSTLIGTSEARLLSFDGDVLNQVDTFDDAEGRDSWQHPVGRPTGRAVDSSRSVRDDSNVHVGGIAHLDDPNGPWKATIEVSVDVHQVIYDDNSDLLLAASAWGLGISTDKDESWRFQTDGLHGKYLRAVAGDMVVLGTADGALYRSDDGGGKWETIADDLPSVRCVAVR